MKKINILLLVLLALAGCDQGREQAGSTPRESPAQPVIALVMKSLANEFFITMAAGAKQHNAHHPVPYKLIVNGIKNESDLAQQVALIDQMIAAGADAIVIAPADSKAVIPALARARKAGVIVVNIDNKLDAGILAQYALNVPFVGPDNRAGARLVGNYLAGYLAQNDQVAILEGVPTAYNSQQRRTGFEDAANANGLDIVTVQSAFWEQTRAAEITAGIVVRFPQLKAILCANDSMALGAVSALRQAGRDKDIRVVGFDNISAVQALVKTGAVLATADQHADQLAVYGIDYALEILAQGGEPEDLTTAVDLITMASL
ncbi:MAG: sugar ABC transporter substrate-binding protein [Gammaproteobacteria bacterium]|nr:sugar ABC transporter substrate-binding protein [Gammaproteobacteria bacterium]MCY4337593.1 sugar ABC transporter substrate-binding protein [Gammaproteobacteria bacterium]